MKTFFFKARTEYLRRKVRGSFQSEGEKRNDDDEGPGGELQHLNLFPLEESSLKGNEEYLKEKKEEKVIYVVNIYIHNIYG